MTFEGLLEGVLGGFVGCWAGAVCIGAFMRRTRPKDTNITCAYCGRAVPMATTDGGIGAVNVSMQDHIRDECEHHPMRALEREVQALRRRAYEIEPLPQPKLMFQVGVEGDKFDPHEESPDCLGAGCVPVRAAVNPDPFHHA